MRTTHLRLPSSSRLFVKVGFVFGKIGFHIVGRHGRVAVVRALFWPSGRGAWASFRPLGRSTATTRVPFSYLPKPSTIFNSAKRQQPRPRAMAGTRSASPLTHSFGTRSRSCGKPSCSNICVLGGLARSDRSRVVLALAIARLCQRPPPTVAARGQITLPLGPRILSYFEGKKGCRVPPHAENWAIGGQFLPSGAGIGPSLRRFLPLLWWLIGKRAGSRVPLSG